ncbi:MAG TPA: response regulator [Burkholderiales bacterium]
MNSKYPQQPDAPLALRILVVDDDRNTREVLLELLRFFGAEACSAASVAEARALLAHWRADVLISDLDMPQEDGYDLISEIRSHPLDGEAPMPAIALTGTTHTDDLARALMAGYDEVLRKPAELGDLLSTIRRVASADPRRRGER